MFGQILKSRRTMRTVGDVPITAARYAVIDTELTGLNERTDSIVSIAAVRMIGGRIDLGDTFYRLTRPRAELTGDSVIIHEITPSEVREQPGVGTVLREFLEFCGGDVIVGHCVSIDLSFITREMKRALGRDLCNPVLDTSVIYEWTYDRYSSDMTLPYSFADSGLFAIAQHFGIPVTGAHNALMDAFITAQVFQRFVPLLAGGGVTGIGELIRLGNPSKGGERDKVSKGVFNF